jgi:hypothetical protein
MSSPTRFYPIAERPYQHKPHAVRRANTEAKRQRRAKRRAINLKALRTLKIVTRWAVAA